MAEMTGTPASVRHKQTRLNRLAMSNLIITEPLRHGSPFSLRTAFPQTAAPTQTSQYSRCHCSIVTTAARRGRSNLVEEVVISTLER
jgi:hypothetical protein